MPISSDETDWFDEDMFSPAYAEEPPTDGDPAAPEAAQRRRQGAQPAAGAGGAGPAATGDLTGALAALERAQEAYESAETVLADAEGRVAVLEHKVAAVEADETAQEWQRAAAREELARARRAFDHAGRRLVRAEGRVEAAQAQVSAEQQAALATMGKGEADEGEEKEPPRFATVELFVEQFVLPNWTHMYVDDRVRWCRKWWAHAEALSRLEALWEAFEVMRLQPAPSFSTWLRDHFDAHMRVLTDPEGVFWDCDADRDEHTAHPQWPSDPAPQGMFKPIKHAQIGGQAEEQDHDQDHGEPAREGTADLDLHKAQQHEPLGS